MDKISKKQNDSQCSCEHCETQKKLYKKIFGFVSSRFLFFAIGLFVSVAILTAYAAQWNDTVKTGDPLTAAKWNDLVNKILNLDGRMGAEEVKQLKQDDCVTTAWVGRGAGTDIKCLPGYYVAGVGVEDTKEEVTNIHLYCCKS
ncbi:MAG: hypothetical protein V1688_01175 [bacterium]